jgi:hypothetical protein
MNRTAIRLSQRLYRTIVRLYPRPYRQEFGAEMEYVFTQSLIDAYEQRGSPALVGVWAGTIIDVGKSLVIQHLNQRQGGNVMKTNQTGIIMQNRIFIWIAAVTALILMVPLIAMQFTSDVDWDINDFVIIGVLLFGMGSLFVLAARKVRRTSRRIALGIVFALAVLYLWAELAVGIFTNWGS